MVGAALTFLTPTAAAVGVSAVVPVLGLLWSNRRARETARSLGLDPAPRGLAVPACLAVAACVSMAVAAAQPALRTTAQDRVRGRSEVSYVVDVSRSMAAAPRVDGVSRLARARSVVRRLHDAVADVPSGLSGLTDRVLPYVFPTADSATFDETLRRSVAIEAPPPEQVSTNATSFAALAALTDDGFFGHATDQRTCVLVSDGETRSYSTRTVADALGGSKGCRLIVVGVGGSGDRVYGADGTTEANYVPDPAAQANLRSLAEAAGGRAFDEHDLGRAVAALRAAAEAGPVRSAPSVPSTRALGPYAAAAGLLAAIGLAGLRLGRRRGVALIRT
jgi:hypothetical protein